MKELVLLEKMLFIIIISTKQFYWKILKLQLNMFEKQLMKY